MEWLGLHFITELPESGQVILNCAHDPFLVLLAYLVACVGCFATLDMAERVAHAEKSASKTRWRWVGSGCLAGGIWAMHFVGMLAFQAPIGLYYQLPVTVFSLTIALLAAWLAMHTLSLPDLNLQQCLKASIGIGLGIATMHYVGMTAMHSSASVYYHPGLFALSIAL